MRTIIKTGNKLTFFFPKLDKGLLCDKKAPSLGNILLAQVN